MKPISYFSEKEIERLDDIEALMDKEIDEIPFPEEEVKINPVKREFEKDVVKMKQLTTVKIEERGAAFHEKKDKIKRWI